MLTTIVVETPGVSAAAAHEAFLEDYETEAFVDVLPVGEPARIRVQWRRRVYPKGKRGRICHRNFAIRIS